jgi:glycosyltransferase involved in cell wall biosynthesis
MSRFPESNLSEMSGVSQKLIGKLCVFGSYDDSELYSRNRVLIDSLSLNAECVYELRPSHQAQSVNNHQRLSSVRKLLSTLCRLARDGVSLFRQRSDLRGADLCFVPYPAYIDLMLLRVVLPKRERPRVIVDAFLCLQDTLARDRGMIKDGGILSRLVSSLERHTLTYPDLVLIDTEQQRRLLINQYGLSEEKVLAVPVGIDESLWTSLPPLPLSGRMRVLFWGTFIPLHGVETIIEAASLLERTHPKIDFRLIGDGQTANSVAGLLEELHASNISWERGLVSAGKLRQELSISHCVLGIFGGSEKAGNVVPYKVYQALASNKPVISRQGAAISMFGDNCEGVIFVPPSDSVSLAEAIAGLYGSYADLGLSLSTRAVYDEHLSNDCLGAKLTAALERL